MILNRVNPYLNNKRAFTVDRSLQDTDLELKKEKKRMGKELKGEYTTSLHSNAIYNANEVHRKKIYRKNSLLSKKFNKLLTINKTFQKLILINI